MDDDKIAFLRAAFPEKDWLPEEVSAMTDFVMACTESAESGEYDDDDEDMDEMPMGKKEKAPDIGIMLGLGPPKKKRP